MIKDPHISKPSRDPEVKAATIVAVATVLAAVITVIGGISVGWLQIGYSGPGSTPNQQAIGVTTTTRPEVRIGITPPDGPVPRCVSVRGTAMIPDYMTVWVAVRSSFHGAYHSLKRVDVDPGRPDLWQVKITLGSQEATSQRHFVYAFALSEETSRLLDSIGTSPEGASTFFLSVLPVSRGVTSEILIRNDHDTAGC